MDLSRISDNQLRNINDDIITRIAEGENGKLWGEGLEVSQEMINRNIAFGRRSRRRSRRHKKSRKRRKSKRKRRRSKRKKSRKKRRRSKRRSRSRRRRRSIFKRWFSFGEGEEDDDEKAEIAASMISRLKEQMKRKSFRKSKGDEHAKENKKRSYKHQLTSIAESDVDDTGKTNLSEGVISSAPEEIRDELRKFYDSELKRVKKKAHKEGMKKLESTLEGIGI